MATLAKQAKGLFGETVKASSSGLIALLLMLHRVFFTVYKSGVLRFSHCGVVFKIIAGIEGPLLIKKILLAQRSDHLDEKSEVCALLNDCHYRVFGLCSYDWLVFVQYFYARQ